MDKNKRPIFLIHGLWNNPKLFEKLIRSRIVADLESAIESKEIRYFNVPNARTSEKTHYGLLLDHMIENILISRFDVNSYYFFHFYIVI